MFRPKLIVNLDHLKSNYKEFCDRVNPTLCAAVLKCDAYGLGINQIALALKSVGCTIFFVTDVSEGVILRNILPDEKIFVLNGPDKFTFKFMKDNRLIPAINTLEQFYLCRDAKNMKVAINLDSGFNRIGLRIQDLNKITKAHFYRMPIQLIMSHLSCAAERDHPFNLIQLQNFKAMLKFFPHSPVSLSASNGCWLGEDYRFNLMRTGAALFGLNTANNQQNYLKPVVYLQATVVQISIVKIGEYIGYGAAFCAKQNMRIAVLLIGFGDGLSRKLNNKGFVWFKDDKKYYPSRIIGNISMDYTVCDISNIPTNVVYPGKIASFLNDFYTINDMAHAIDAAGCAEIFTSIGNGKRYIRQWIDK